MKTKKYIGIFVIIVGIILFVVGLFIPTPGEKLSTYSFQTSPEYSQIEEYVGGDAYNYIIGASLVGGKIAGTIAMKGVFIGVGVLIACIGLIYMIHNAPNATGYQEESVNQISQEPISEKVDLNAEQNNLLAEESPQEKNTDSMKDQSVEVHE